jgi:hypothetical protein
VRKCRQRRLFSAESRAQIIDSIPKKHMRRQVLKETAMQDDVVAAKGSKAGGNGKAKAAGVPPGPETQIARLIIRALWQQEWNAANPGSTPAARTEAWKAVRGERMEADLKKVRMALMSLRRDGVAMTIAPKTADAAAEGAAKPE